MPGDGPRVGRANGWLALARDEAWQILLATIMIGAAPGLTHSAVPDVIFESVPAFPDRASLVSLVLAVVVSAAATIVATAVRVNRPLPVPRLTGSPGLE